MRDYDTIVVVGGGCYGAYYVRQLSRAAAARALSFRHLVVVDRDPACRVATAPPPEVDRSRLQMVIDDWTSYFDGYLGAATESPPNDDAIVPSPLMPHLMYQWLLRRARGRWPGRRVETRPLDPVPAVPWTRAAPDGTQYVSFAEWMCPVNCVEPARCPKTRGDRSWSLPPTVEAYVREERARGHALSGPAIFHCTHRAYGVGMFDVCDVVAADRLVAAEGATGASAVLVGTMSHCHGALNILELGEAGGGNSPARPQPVTEGVLG
jgi:hypothetical protein